MSWVTVIWSASAGMSLILGAIHFAVWLEDRKAWAYLLFSVMAVSVAWLTGLELTLMHTDSIQRFGAIQRWGHLPVFLLIAGLVGLVGTYLGTGRWWLGGAAVGLRLVSLVVNFMVVPNLNYRAITALEQVPFLGSQVWVVAEGVPRSLTRIGELSSLLVLTFVVDASLTLWRKGDPGARRRAWVVGGSTALFIVVAASVGSLIHMGILHMPYLISFPFLVIVMGMGFELSRDVIRAGRMAEELQESAETMSLAANAANLALWRWDILRDLIWVSPNGRRLYGIPEGETVSLARFFQTLHPDDRPATSEALNRALGGGRNFSAEYRVDLGDGALRWVTAQGQVEFDATGKPLCLRGVSGDITDRKAAEIESRRHLEELAHVTRVTTLSELSGSLAHELNQPLAIILSNAQAAHRLLAKAAPDLKQVREILADIVSEDRRAGEVIQRLRALLERGETAHVAISLNAVVTEVLLLTNADLTDRGVTVNRDLTVGLPQIEGDDVQLQQVVLNLILNGADAMSTNPPGTRRLHLATARRDGMVCFSLRDEGCGLPGDAEQIFTPFFTTKPHGLGMGLAICRSIVAAHEGRLWAKPHPQGGTIFYLEIPALEASAR